MLVICPPHPLAGLIFWSSATSPPHPPRSGMLDLSGLPLKMDPAEVAERMGLPLDRCLGERGKGRGGR